MLRRTAKTLPEILECFAEGNKLDWGLTRREAQTLLHSSTLHTLTVPGPPPPSQVVSWISATTYPSSDLESTETYSHISLFLTREGFRGKGYGREMWEAGVTHSPSTSLGLDSVDETIDYYKTKGFHVAFHLPLYTLSGGACAGALQRAVQAGSTAGQDVADFTKEELNVTYEEYSPSLLPVITQYDSHVAGVQRGRMLECHLSGLPHAKAFVALRERVCVGYIIAVQEEEGEKDWEIAPLIADTPRIALCLLAMLGQHIQGDAELAIWPPAANPMALALVTAVLGGVQNPLFSGLTRMYKGPLSTSARVERVYGVVSPEFG